MQEGNFHGAERQISAARQMARSRDANKCRKATCKVQGAGEQFGAGRLFSRSRKVNKCSKANCTEQRCK